jgi:hypothetical protein
MNIYASDGTDSVRARIAQLIRKAQSDRTLEVEFIG